MSKRTPHPMITAALRDLDPASEADLTEAERERADATLSRILATPIDAPTSVEPARLQHHRRNRLLVSLGLVGAAGVTVPVLLLSGGSAYAPWTPKPDPLTGEAANGASATCRNALSAADSGERAVVAERRGEWTFVLLAGAASEAICLMPDRSDGSGVPGKDGFFGSYSPNVTTPPPPSADGLVQTGAMSSSTDEGWFTWAEGFVGSDVTGVTVHTPSNPDIEATVAGGRFVAWWPGDGESWSYTVHLVDGSSRRIN